VKLLKLRRKRKEKQRVIEKLCKGKKEKKARKEKVA
jgi:hypothetical protein